MQVHEKRQHNTTLWVSDHVHEIFREEWFDLEREDLTSSANHWDSGRQSIMRLNVDGQNFIRRHYCRGGVPARITRDKFIFHGIKSSRPYQELHLLQMMWQLNLPTPEPIAARCIVNKLTYTADIIVREIINAKTLAQVLSIQQLQSSVWRKIGKVVRQIHSHDIQHRDLNADNILINESGEIFLIDFDRCVQKKYTEQWGIAGLDRLGRSLNKFKHKNPQFNFEEINFEELLVGYRD